jgi:hypothetical protein
MDVRVEWSCCRVEGGSREDPNGEYVCLKNYNGEPADMTGWRLRDDQEHEYRFPHFVLAVGATVKVRSGPGQNTATELHWASGLVWNNGGDTILLIDTQGREVCHFVY